MSERTGEQYLLRLPPGMRKRLQRRADMNGHSLSYEIVAALAHHLTKPSLETRVLMLENKLRAMEGGTQ